MQKNNVLIKYRPNKLGEVFGQDKAVAIINKLIKSNEIYDNHYLISGVYGTGKTTLARIIAKTILCEGRAENDIDSCDECPACKEVDAGGIMRGFQEIDAGSQGGVDEIRGLVELAKKHPGNNSGWKVYLIDECHLLTKQAASAMLKVLESKYKVVFILVTTDAHKLIKTIKSRLRSITLDEPSEGDIKLLLLKIIHTGFIEFNVSDEKEYEKYIGAIAQKTAPHIRDSVAILDDFRIRFCDKEGSFVGTAAKVKDFLSGDHSTWFELLKMINNTVIDPVQYENVINILMENEDRSLEEKIIGFIKLVAGKAIGRLPDTEGLSLAEYKGVFWVMYEALKSKTPGPAQAFFKEVVTFALVECAQMKKDGYLDGFLKFSGEIISRAKQDEAFLDAVGIVAKNDSTQTGKVTKTASPLGDVDYE